MGIPNDGGPAFPRPEMITNGVLMTEHNGMSLRDYFAGRAMQGMVYGCGDPQTSSVSDDKLAAWAYSLADAMLAYREKKE